jgi:wyosine [tRNA(Phe)-imidazoG37] synthetase (radical SAM superfamily)
MFTSVFGPVPSRRLGMSLGLDLVPKKVCSLDCVYCEVGKTTKLTLERMEYVPFEKITGEVRAWFDHSTTDPDYITFSGSGEPTLNSRIGELIDFVKNLRPDIPVAVLTNGTLLYDADVRNALMEADLVLPSLDAAREESFQRINRPAGGLSMKRYIQGLVDFRKIYRGKIHLEVCIIPGYNNGEEDILSLKEVLEAIGPDKVQLNTLDRPGTVEGLRPAGHLELMEIKESLALPQVDIIAQAPRRKNIAAYRTDAETAIMETIARRPCTVQDLSEILGLHDHEIQKYLGVLASEKRIAAVRQERGIFYRKAE